VNYSDRSKTAIQPYLSDQWFVRMAELAEPALEAVREGKVKFFPERHGQQYLAWLGEKRDWPISRQLWWGHRIPVWSSRSHPMAARTTFRNAGNFDSRIPAPVFLKIENGEFLAATGSNLESLRAEAISQGFIEVFYSPRPREDGTPEFFYCPRHDDAASRMLLDQIAVQDPDVLDTWFSSGLWPHSTLGWPGETADLAKWYPGAVLLTGRDIITLWVARMVMMGLYNMNAVPFAHVAINPTILDGKGERMSKSKGNGVDPVEIIDTHGADALRFTLATMATETQDVRLPVKKDAQGRNTSEKFDLGRNFCTKLWNASRFVMGQIGEGNQAIRQSGNEGKTFSLADRWILSRLGATLRDVKTALATYRFDAYAKAVYDFFWRDFCDWYLEASKPAMADTARAGSTGDVLLAVLDSSLRLLHPVIPFITEEIWSHLSAVRSDRSLPGLKLPPSKRLVKAAWPTAPSGDLLGDGGGAAEEFARVQEVVGALRNLRNEHKVEPRRVIDVVLVSGQFSPESAGLIELLALAKLQPGSAGANAARLMCAGAELAVEGVVDPNAEANRLAKRREELTRTITTLQARLASPAYTDKAPAKLVEQTRQQLADAQAELAKL
jgi:valyl-tRNA synthetase